MASIHQQGWREICKAASVEENSERLSALLADLITALDEQEQNQQESRAPRRSVAFEA
jgi:hypothetical protein